MDSFPEWVKSAKHPCFQRWGGLAVELGASWDSFRRDDKESIVHDFVKGGIPILAARDITVIASAEITPSRPPLAVFWDIENVPIPAKTSGRDITTSLKSILAPHGELIQFRVYASIGLNHIPPGKRSDLQLSGCHLVDCPHQGRKEVADKMIIVDAMQFAFQHPESATLCFITGDVDYAYLLASLQRPQWKTIVISRGTSMQSMLHVNCDVTMRWESDILKSKQIRGGITNTVAAPLPAVNGASVAVSKNKKKKNSKKKNVSKKKKSTAITNTVAAPLPAVNGASVAVSTKKKRRIQRKRMYPKRRSLRQRQRRR
jgi:hypothetical protein